MEEFAQAPPAEVRAACVGAAKQRDWITEMAMFTAWHMVFFQNQLQAEKLKPWSYYRTKLRGIPEQVVPQDWQTRKAERQRQMEQFRKHAAQRSRKPVKRGR